MADGVRVAGVDEAGRGPLAGPVVAAAVILDPAHGIPGLADSKTLGERARERVFAIIMQHARAVGIGLASHEEIDAINILHASMLAMRRAVDNLPLSPTRVLCDGNRCPELRYPVQAVVRGDATVACISAASVVAKVTRDRIMLDLHEAYPVYGFDRHKGYPTKAHREVLRDVGPSRVHRRSFAPVRDSLGAVARR